MAVLCQHWSTISINQISCVNVSLSQKMHLRRLCKFRMQLIYGYLSVSGVIAHKWATTKQLLSWLLVPCPQVSRHRGSSYIMSYRLGVGWGHFPKMSVIWKFSKLTVFLLCLLISMSGKKQERAAVLCYPAYNCSQYLPNFFQTLTSDHCHFLEMVLLKGEGHSI